MVRIVVGFPGYTAPQSKLIRALVSTYAKVHGETRQLRRNEIILLYGIYYSD